ncbi:hypothetical protein ACF07T_14970 [Streptomyces sp. NPDC015184]|uniref:hypothetical protein n=1 Tax=Streptomyces sp. NPDC015184 TaxID=3364946 RepID=UPI0036FDE97F
MRSEQGCWSRSFRRLLLPDEAACFDLGEDVELDEAFQLGAEAFDVLRQQFVVEGSADGARSEGAGGLVEGGEDAGAVRVLGQVWRGRLDRKTAGGSSDGLPGDREVLETGLGLPQPVLQFVDLRAEFVGQGPGAASQMAVLTVRVP